jgi:glutamate-1-semialdehyde 2,1-aminomutase
VEPLDGEAESMTRRETSRQLFERALLLEPGGVGGSDQRGPRAGFEPHPIFMARGTGAYLEDVDGNRYIDYLAAWGPLILGHRPAAVNAAVHRTLDDMGATLGFNHELEIAAAQAAIDAVPCWERVRFCNTGTEAVMLGLRAARGYTGRTKVLRFEGHYHGWSDLIHFSAKPDLDRAGSDSAPIPVPATGGMVAELADSLVVRPWNDFDALDRTFAEMGGELAAVICEPILAGASVIPPAPGYLERMRHLTAKHGVVLIFDEVKTGFRVALGGAQELYGVIPDMSIAAKALGAGFPVGAVGGKKELFEPFVRGTVTQGSTYQANPMVLAACVATIEELRRPGFFDRITAMGEALTEGLTALADEAGIAAHARGVGPILQMVFADHQVENFRDFARSSNPDQYRDFWRGMVDAGIMFQPQPSGCWFVSGAHTQVEVDKTLEAAGDVLMRMAAQSKSPRTGARA